MCNELVLLSSPIPVVLFMFMFVYVFKKTVYVFKTGAIELSVLCHLYYLVSLFSSFLIRCINNCV